MSADSAVGLIAYPAPPEEWIREVAAVVDGTVVLVVSDPPAEFEAPYADIVTTSEEPTGFGKARRLSMILAAEFGDQCVVTDGDGQYTPDSIRTLQETLADSPADVIIPQRESQAINVEFEGETVDREPFERLETLCAADKAGVDLDPEFDCQPGGFAFQQDVLPEILPTGEWVADWEITVATLQSCRYETTTVAVNEDQQNETTFTWADQLRKLQQIRERGVDVRAVYENNEDRFDRTGRELVRTALEQLQPENQR